MGLLGAVAACRPPGAAGAETVSPGASTTWIDAPLTGDDPQASQKLQDLSNQGLSGRLVRLDRLLDLFDAARFGADEYARETLWTALGGHPIGIGSEATRDATARLLEEALAIDTAARESGALEPSHLDWLAEAIMLLSADLERPASAEGLSIATSAYRQLAQDGHPRIADNARWRLYDHARGTLEGASQAAAGERLDVAVHALYVEQESVERWLAEGPDPRPAPSADELWKVVERQRAALAQVPRWAPVVRGRAQQDDTLHDTLRSVLPARREPSWPAPEVDANTGWPDAGGPVVVVQAGLARVDAGRPQARSVKLQGDAKDPAKQLERALAAAVSADGRGTILLAVDPDLPAPQLQTVLRAVRRAQISRVDLAVREPAKDAQARLRALPVVVARSADGTQELAALRSARVAVHLDGRGAVLAADGRPLQVDTSRDSQLRRWAQTLAEAYPAERIVRVTLGSDVSVRQILRVLAAFGGGPQRRFGAVGWWAGGTPAQSRPRAQEDRRVELRATLSRASVRLEQPYPLTGRDQPRVDTFGQQLRECLPELETALSKPLRIGIRFDEGRLQQVSVPKIRAPKERVTAFEECASAAGLGLRLANHRDRVDIEAVVETASE